LKNILIITTNVIEYFPNLLYDQTIGQSD